MALMMGNKKNTGSTTAMMEDCPMMQSKTISCSMGTGKCEAGMKRTSMPKISKK